MDSRGDLVNTLILESSVQCNPYSVEPPTLIGALLLCTRRARDDRVLAAVDMGDLAMSIGSAIKWSVESAAVSGIIDLFRTLPRPVGLIVPPLSDGRTCNS